MNRCFLSSLLILFFLCLIASECYAWPPEPDVYISDWHKYTTVGEDVEVYAEVISGGPIDYWDWDFQGALNGTYDEYDYDSTATVYSYTPGRYEVDAEGTDYYGQWDSDYAYVYVVAVTEVISSKDVACIGENVTFGALTDPPNCAHLVTVTWSGGGTPPTGSGSQFTTSWSTPGTKTVTATCGDSDEQKNVDIVEVKDVTFSPTALCADGSSTSTASATITPDTRTITWSIQGDALGCTINSSTGVITAGTTAGTITVRAADSVLSGCYAEANIDVVKVQDVTFSPTALCADGISTSTASATITPDTRTITWSIQGDALGCTINSSTGVITAGTTAGTIKVRAADSVLSGCYAEANIYVVKVQDVTFSPTALCADGSSTSTASATITPDTRTITWSIQGAALGCSINPSTGVITAGTNAGTITVRAADSVLSGCYAEANIDVVEVASLNSDKDSAVLCENITFTVTTDPSGHENLVTWSGGGNPASQNGGATFTTRWPCIGGKTVTATCGDSSKSKNVTVSLPSGCSTGTQSASLQSQIVSTEPNCPSGTCGATQMTGLAASIEAKYNNCKWAFQVTALGDVVSGACPSNYCNIENGNESCITENNYCGIVYRFMFMDGCVWLGDFIPSSTPCVEIHEAKHYEIFETQLAQKESWLLGRPSMADMAIDCSDPNTISCQAAKAARQSAIENDIVTAYNDAYAVAAEEGPPEEAARPCFSAIADLICSHAQSQGWPSCGYCP